MGNSQGEVQELIQVDCRCWLQLYYARLVYPIVYFKCCIKNEMLTEKAVKLCLQFEVSRKYDSGEIRFNTNTFQL